jgi:hypothetical protein
MTFDDLKKLTISLLENYETAWQQNAALETILENYPMPDGTKGIPQWQELRDFWMNDPECRSRAHERFAALYDQIRSAPQESDLRELLRKVPPMGGVQ